MTLSLEELRHFCHSVPLRLNEDERQLLNVLQHMLEVSEYTDHVDVMGRRPNKASRILEGLLEACHIATGLAVASGLEHAVLEQITSSLQGENKDSDLNGNRHKKKKEKRMTKKKERKMVKKNKTKMKQTYCPPPEEGTSPGATTSLANQETTAEPTSSSLFATRNLAARAPKQNAAFFQTLFEIGRRHKVLNPSSMRTTYGKLMYMLQDAQSPSIAKSLGFSLHKELLLVESHLEEHGCISLLSDERLVGATRCIPSHLTRSEMDELLQQKQTLKQQLIQDFSTPKSQLSSNEVSRVLESIADAVQYVDASVAPVQTMLDFLQQNFDPESPEGEYSLQLRARSLAPSLSYANRSYGWSSYNTSSSSGPTLNHSHSTQYAFVSQSLHLWKRVQQRMHNLWLCADADLLSTSRGYHLHNTGQGLHRVQQCPQVGRVMSSLLRETQSQTGSAWVGLSVIHLGDRDVPNALVFIDKYTQIPRFLHPVVNFLQGLVALCNQDATMEAYVKNNFGSRELLQKLVLCDYFKHGFDGSGDDGGSCIDGRLTSSWNWTSLVAKKPYYHAFLLSGFQGFDGDFK